MTLFASEMPVGTWNKSRRWIEFGKYRDVPMIWRVLEVKGRDNDIKAAFLLLDSGIGEMTFGGSERWDESDIKGWLNDVFYTDYFNLEEQLAIVNSRYSYGEKKPYDERETYKQITSSKIFLLSDDEAEDPRYFADNDDRRFISPNSRDTWWWLRTFCSLESQGVLTVVNGEISRGGTPYYQQELGVRPALRVNLLSSIFKSKKVLLQKTDFPAQPAVSPKLISSGPAQNMIVGTWGEQESFRRWIKFGENIYPMVWRVLEVSENGTPNSHRKTALLLLDSQLRESTLIFNRGGILSWETTQIKDWLNNDFYNGYFKNNEKAAIVCSEYSYDYGFGMGEKSTSSKVFLLSSNEASDKRYFRYTHDRKYPNPMRYPNEFEPWWLRSRGRDADRAMYVSEDGLIDSSVTGDDNYAVRPALRVNLLSSIFKFIEVLVLKL